MNTTAIYQNRIDDKNRVEIDLNLEEFGDNKTKFILPNNDLFAIGYNRIVYGDHGPYVEFSNDHIRVDLVGKFNNVDVNELPENPDCYYYWLYPANNPEIKVYLQLKPVSDLPNAPKRKDRRESSFNREEGYADYKRGFLYVDPYDFKW